MTDMIVNLHLREMPEGDFLATLPGRPGFEVRGETAGAALEKARGELSDIGMTVADGVRENTPVSETESTRSSGRFSAPQTSEEEDLLRQVMILDHVENEDKLSQRRLAKLLDLNLSTVNQIVKRLVKKGYVKTRRLNGRSVAYYLTPQGFSEKLRLVLSYTRCTIGFFSSVRDLVNTELARLNQEHGARTVAIVGTGELAEAAYLSSREQGMSVLSVHDGKQAGSEWLGYEIKHIDALNQSAADVIVRADLSRDNNFTLSGTEVDAKHLVDLAQLLSRRLGQFARRIDSEDDSGEPDAPPEVAYG
jgi:DNA-binding MarR family transcriptional regulator